MLRLASTLLFVLFCFAPARADAPDPSTVGTLDVEIAKQPANPYVGEMVLLKIKAVLFQTQVGHQTIEQPALENFSWIQLGPDKWDNSDIRGRPVIVIERMLAVYPAKSGRLTIDPFIDHLTYLTADNARHDVDIRSKPVTLDIRPPEGIAGKTGSWWMPVRSLTVSDHWQPEPDRLGPGEAAHRTVIIEAEGITADRLPPAPKLLSPGVMTFGGTVERTTTVTPAGPFARAIYRWDVRLATEIPAVLEAVQVPWFDTKARIMRVTAIPARRITLGKMSDAIGAQRWKPSRLLVVGAGFGSLFGALLVLSIGSSTQHRSLIAAAMRRLRAWRDLAEMRRAVRSRDARAVRSAFYSLARRDPDRLRACLANASVRDGLLALDRSLFGSGGGAVPDISRLSKAIADAWNEQSRVAAR